MAALTTFRNTRKMGADSPPMPDLLNYGMAASTKMFVGGLGCLNAAGAAVPGGATAVTCVGRIEAGPQAIANVYDNSAGLALAMNVTLRQGTFKWNNSAAGDLIAAANVGQDAYVVDDQTVALTDANGTRCRAGKILQVDTDGVWVLSMIMARDIGGAGGAVNAGSQLSFPVTLANIANGQLIGPFTPGFAGRIKSTSFVTTTPATTAAKAATLQVRITGTNITGGVLALTSANQTPLGAVVAGTAVTALNTFTAVSTIDVQASAVTTFIEGAGVLLITLA